VEKFSRDSAKEASAEETSGEKASKSPRGLLNGFGGIFQVGMAFINSIHRGDQKEFTFGIKVISKSRDFSKS
jgi:hypothetical protein